MVLRRYKDEVAGRGGKQEFYFPTPVAEGRVPGGTVLLGTLVVAGIVYGAWYYLSATDRSVADMVPVLPDRLVSLLDNLPWTSGSQTPPAATTVEAPSSAPVSAPPTPPAPVVTVAPPTTVAAAPSAPPPTPGGASISPPPPPPAAAAPVAPPTPVAATTPPRPPAAAPAPAPQATIAAPPAPHGDEEEVDTARQDPTPLSPAATAPPAAPQAPAAPADGKVYGAQNGTTRVQVRAVQDSWVQIRDSQDIIFTRVLKRGDVYRVPDRPGVRLRTGNAGGLVVVTDGVAGQPMGSVGQVLRDVPLEPKPAR
ncbi:DUF4115 domain-containing protein [Azospirillum sp.]|uniref:DUF4115 domain-containing protein n=1 Tax=Azospirillum sp. TaxID=34012 RepID=UPI003D72AC51